MQQLARVFINNYTSPGIPVPPRRTTPTAAGAGVNP